MNRPSAANTPKQFSVHLSPIPFDEKAAFVHSVCAALIDSRFGRGRSRPVVIDLRETPKPAVFYDMTIEGPVPCYAILPDSEMARPYMADAIRCELAYAQNASAAAGSPNLSPSTLGRGSP